MIVDGGDNDVHVGALADRVLKRLDALRSGQDAHAGDVLCAALEEVVGGGDHGVAGGQHGVENEALTARQVVRQAVRVGLDLQGVLIAAHAQEADLGGGQHAGHTLEHAQACAQDWDHDRARLGEL